MSKFLVNHFARSVAKTVRTQQKTTSSQTNPKQDQEADTWKTFGIIFLVLILILLVLIVIM